MVKFNFTVCDVDAENIMSCLQDRINKENEQILKTMDLKFSITEASQDKLDAVNQDKVKKYDAEIAWYRSSIKYTKGLIEIMSKSTVRI